MRRLRAFAVVNGGATVVEFALVVGPLILFMFGLVEAGRYLWLRQALFSVANVTARCMGVGQTACSDAGAYNGGKAAAFITETAAGLRVSIVEADVTLDPSATCAGVSNFSRVDIETRFVTAFPMIGPFAGGVPVSAWACFPNQA